MEGSLSLVGGIVVLTILLHTSECSRSTKINGVWTKHVIRTSEFACADPQPRAIPFKDLLGRKIRHIAALKIHPVSTVLHRCESAGCCSRANESCTAIKEDEVELVFGVAENRFRYEVIIAKNHTKCGCK